MTDKILLNCGPSESGWHAREAFLRCPRLYAYEHELHSGGTGDNDALDLGSLVHVALAHYYKQLQCRQRGEDPSAYYDPNDAVDLAARVMHDPFMGPRELIPERLVYLASTAKAMFQAYASAYYGETFEVLHVEEVFSAILRNKYPFTARIDLIVKDKAGKVWIFDHKTMFKLETKSILSYTLSGQILMLATIGHATWRNDFGGVRINLLGKVAPYKFARESPQPVPGALSSIIDSIVYAEEGIAALKASGLDPARWPAVFSDLICVHRYGPCRHFDRCRWGK